MTENELMEAPPAAPPAAQAPDLTDMMRLAVEQGEAGVAALERIVALHERMESQRAEREFSVALAAFQRDVPVIPPNRKGAHNVPYADRVQVMSYIQPLLTRHGFSVMFDGEQDEAGYTAICHVHHTGGHSVTSRFRVPREAASKRMNISQAEGSASEYAMRYALKSALNLRMGDADDDGEAAGRAAPITEQQAADLQALCEEIGQDMASFLAWAGVSSLDQLPAAKHRDAVRLLERKRRAV